MLLLKKIRLTQFRNYTIREFPVAAKIVGISGLNGSGKTNLLDAVYYLCYTKSYFQSRELHNVQNGQNGFRIEGEWQNADVQSKVVCVWKEQKKTVSHNDSEYERLSDHIGKYNAVMIAPDDIELINEGSEIRRRYMDGILSQRDPQYLQHLLNYQKVLQQRNAYLKQCNGHFDHPLIDVYDAQLAQSGTALIAGRTALGSELPSLLQNYYSKLSSDREQVQIFYKPAVTLPQLLLQKFHEARPRDLDYRRTTTGPHLDDWMFTIGTDLLKTHASQGQKKSYLISLKLAHIQLLMNGGKYPVLLLDDIFEKLDSSRLGRLFALLKTFELPQIFVTHTNGKELQEQLGTLGEEVLMVEL